MKVPTAKFFFLRTIFTNLKCDVNVGLYTSTPVYITLETIHAIPQKLCKHIRAPQSTQQHLVHAVLWRTTYLVFKLMLKYNFELIAFRRDFAN